MNDFDEAEYQREAATMDYLPRPEEIAERAAQCRSRWADGLQAYVDSRNIRESTSAYFAPATRPSGKPFSDAERAKIVAMTKAGEPQRAIAEALGCNRRSVGEIQRKLRGTTSNRTARTKSKRGATTVPITQEQRAEIVSLLKSGLRSFEVAERVGCCQDMVYKVSRRHLQETGEHLLKMYKKP